MDLIEAYYAVAQHMQENGRSMIDIASKLAKMADSMSEARMQEKQPTQSSEEGK